MTVGHECAGDQPNQSFERRCQSAPFEYRTHCLVCESDLSFDFAEKKPDVAKYQISAVSKIVRKTRKWKLHVTLKKVAAKRTDPLVVELAAKLSYATCIRAEEVKYQTKEVYSIRHLSRKLLERYDAEGSKAQLAQRTTLPKIILLQEEANSIVTDTILASSWSSSQNCQRVSAEWSEEWTDWGLGQILSVSEWAESRKADCWSTNTIENFPWHDLL